MSYLRSCRTWNRASVLALAVVVASLCGRSVAATAPYGIEKREVWSTSHVFGTPEPPPAFRTVNAFPHLKFEKPDDVVVSTDLHRVFVIEQAGKIFSFPDRADCEKADLAIDLRTAVEQRKDPDGTGLDSIYGIAFHPKFSQNHYVYLCYVLAQNDQQHKRDNGTRVSRFTMTRLDPPQIDPASEVNLLQWRGGGHNGGCVKFGRDGYLYVSAGDAGDPNPPDPFNTGQDISDFLSSILRIDVDHPSDGKNYGIPSDNPFVHLKGAKPEVWAYGLRNPWRMNFDRQTGKLWIGDVGWELWESIVCATAGGNYGWSINEGPNPVHPNGKRGPTPILPAAVSYPHTVGASVSGGTVYRGTRFPELSGCYVFGDWVVQRLWAAKVVGAEQNQLEPYRLIAETGQKIVAFAEEEDGELLILDYGGGGVWRLERNPAASQKAEFPRKLSQTGLFSSTRDQTPQPGVIPFTINAPQWADGAASTHWVAIPSDQPMTWGHGPFDEDVPVWPTNGVLVRTLSFPTADRQLNVETQLLHFDGKQWHGYTYAWREDQSDADLVSSEGQTRLVSIPDPSSPGGQRKQRWQYSSRSQCITCHNSWCNYRLAFNESQLDRVVKFGDVSDNQVRTFRHLKLLLLAKDGSEPEWPQAKPLPLTNPSDASADLTERARSYLHANCSHCHRFGAGGSALFDVRKEMDLEHMKLVDQKPNLGDFGLSQARLIASAAPDRSVVLYRMAKLGRERMPHIGSEVVDVAGVELMRQWIASLPASTQDAGPNEAQRVSDLRQLEEASLPPSTVAASVDRLLGSTSGGLALVSEIGSGRLPKETTQVAAEHGLASPEPLVRDLFRRFDPNENSADRLGTSFDPQSILSLKGDAGQGKKIFFQQAGGLCARCHRVGGEGGQFGPELTHIASKYQRADLLDNIIYPSKSIAPGFASYVVKTKQGEVFSGLLVSRDDKQIVLKDASMKTTTIQAGDINRVVEQKTSAMPEGLLADLTAQQAADLLTYLAERK